MTLQSLAQAGVERGYPGMAMMTVGADGQRQAAAAGWSDAERRIKMRPDTAFHIGSITKTFTAVETLRLVDRGKLSLNDTISKLLGSKVAHIQYADRITVSQLLDHSSNIYPINNNLEYLNSLLGDAVDPQRIWSPADLVALADSSRNPPAGTPGKGHTYSDTNYLLLQMIIEDIAHRRLKDLIKADIIDPLGMASTYFNSDVLEGKINNASNRSRGYLIYTKDVESVIRINPMFHVVPSLKSPLGPVYDTTLAAERSDSTGGIISTLPDMLKFGTALYCGKLLSPKSQGTLTAALAGIEQIDVNKHRTWALQAMRKPYGIVLYKEGDGAGGNTALLAYLPATGRLFAGFTNSFGYFTEVDYMLDDVIPVVDASPRQH